MRSNYTTPTFDYPALVEAQKRSRIVAVATLIAALILTVSGLGIRDKKMSTACYSLALLSAVSADSPELRSHSSRSLALPKPIIYC